MVPLHVIVDALPVEALGVGSLNNQILAKSSLELKPPLADPQLLVLFYPSFPLMTSPLVLMPVLVW